MTPADNDMDPEGDDLIAAEYVLGVLPADERQTVARRIEVDHDFARLVDGWEVRLSPLSDDYVETPPPGNLKAAIDHRLFASPSPPAAAGGRIGFWSSLAFWRGLAVMALAVLAIFVALPFVNPPAPQPEVRLAASLTSADSDVKYLAVYDAARHQVGLSHIAGERGAGKDFELWMIEGKNPPVSMGVIPMGAATHIELPAAVRQKLAAGAVLAISLEPAGGSTTGQPTGPVVASGDLKSI